MSYKSMLRAAGMRDVILDKLNWGMYWCTNKGEFREGHFDENENAFEWPIEISAKPIPLNMYLDKSK